MRDRWSGEPQDGERRATAHEAYLQHSARDITTRRQRQPVSKPNTTALWWFALRLLQERVSGVMIMDASVSCLKSVKVPGDGFSPADTFNTVSAANFEGTSIERP